MNREAATKLNPILRRQFAFKGMRIEERIIDWEVDKKNGYLLLWSKPSMVETIVHDLPNPIFFKEFVDWFHEGQQNARRTVHALFEQFWLTCSKCNAPHYRHYADHNKSCCYDYGIPAYCSIPISLRPLQNPPHPEAPLYVPGDSADLIKFKALRCSFDDRLSITVISKTNSHDSFQSQET